MPSQVYANYAMVPPQVSFSFRVESSIDFLCHVLVSVIIFAFCFQVPMLLPCSVVGVNPLGFQHCNPSEHTLGRHICLLLMACSPCQQCNEWLLLPLLGVEGSFMLLIQLSLSHSNNMVEHTTLGTWQSHLIHLPTLHDKGVVSISR